MERDSTQIVLKKLHDGTSSDNKKMFAKEVEILAKVAHENIVSMLSVCGKPLLTMMELCKFSFIPFGGIKGAMSEES